MAKFTIKVFEDILQRMINRFVARSGLTDLNEVAGAKTVLAAAAREIDENYFQLGNLLDLFSIFRAKGDDLDKRALDYGPDAPSRLLAIKATGSLVFSRVSTGPLVNIPIGTRVEVPGQNPPLSVITTAAGNIPNMTLSSAAIPVTAELGGSAGNAAANTLTKFKGAKPAGVDSVINTAALTGGQDRESDDSLAHRLAQYVATLARGTPQALEFAALNNGVGRGLGLGLGTGQRCVFASLFEDPINVCRSTLYIDDGSGTAEALASNYLAPENLTSGPAFPGDVAQGGEQYLYSAHKPIKRTASIIVKKNGVMQTLGDDYVINTSTGQVVMVAALIAGDVVTLGYTWFTGLVAEIQKTIDGNKTDRLNYPGWRAAGTIVFVDVPIIESISIEGTIVVADTATPSIVRAAVISALTAYINKLGIGNGVLVAEIIAVAMGVDGVEDFILTTPTVNIPITFDTLPRASSATVEIH